MLILFKLFHLIYGVFDKGERKCDSAQTRSVHWRVSGCEHNQVKSGQ